MLFEHDLFTKQIYTDASGRYSSTDVGAGPIRVHVVTRAGQIVDKTVSIVPGRNAACDLSVSAAGQISGKVTGEDRKPIAGLRVTLLSANYEYGARRYIQSGFAITDPDGEYIIDRVAPGRAYIVFAKRMLQRKAISGPFPDPEKRDPVLMPAYYPGAESIESATGVILSPGEKREFIDIRMRNGPSRCMEGMVQPRDGAGAVRFEIEEAEPEIWPVANPTVPAPRGGANGFLILGRAPPAGSIAGPDGVIRICDLHPGDYVLEAYSTGSDTGALGKDSLAASKDLVKVPVTVADRDGGGIVLSPHPQPDLQVDVAWDGKPPEIPIAMRVAIDVTSADEDRWDATSFTNTVPHRFSVPVRNEKYFVTVQGVPAGVYVKDVTCGGRSYLNEVFPAAAASSGLQVILARDGARVVVKAVDQDGNAVAGAAVVIMPAHADSEAAMASAMITGEADASGAWSSAMIAPGKYYVIATSVAVNHGVETVAKLWRARASAEEVEAAPGATIQLNRVVIPIE